MTERTVEKVVWFSQMDYYTGLYRPVKCEVEKGQVMRTTIEYNRKGEEIRRTDYLDTAFKMDDGYSGWEPSSETHLSDSFDTFELCQEKAKEQNLLELSYARDSLQYHIDRIAELETKLREAGYEV